MSNTEKHCRGFGDPGIRLRLALNEGLRVSKNTFDAQKRKSMQTLLSIAAIGAMANTQAIAGVLSAEAVKSDSAFDTLECMLILRAGNTHLHLHMHNKGETDVVISGFESQSLQFDSTSLNISDALRQTFVVKTQERIMVRLDVEKSLLAKATIASTLDMNSATRSLPLGTRVVAVTAQVRQGIGTLVKAPEPVFAMNAWSAMHGSKLQVG